MHYSKASMLVALLGASSACVAFSGESGGYYRGHLARRSDGMAQHLSARNAAAYSDFGNGAAYMERRSAEPGRRRRQKNRSPEAIDRQIERINEMKSKNKNPEMAQKYERIIQGLERKKQNVQRHQGQNHNQDSGIDVSGKSKFSGQMGQEGEGSMNSGMENKMGGGMGGSKNSGMETDMESGKSAVGESGTGAGIGAEMKSGMAGDKSATTGGGMAGGMSGGMAGGAEQAVQR